MPEVPKINIIRGGRLLDIQAHSTREVDILIEAGAIKEIARGIGCKRPRLRYAGRPTAASPALSRRETPSGSTNAPR